MAKAYRFDDEKPKKGTIVYAFSTLKALKDFANMQGGKGTQKFWEIEGTIIENDGTIDGIRIKVDSVKEVF